MTRWRDRGAWLVATLPLAGLTAMVYAAFEWLFLVTKPSSLAVLPFATQLSVLAHAPMPTVWPLLGIQLIASGLSLLAFPRLRALAVLPAALIGGALLLVLVDNFTYTLLGVGVLTSDGPWRVAYAAVFAGLVGVAGDRLLRWTSAASRSRLAMPTAAMLTTVLAVAPVAFSAATVQIDQAAPPSSTHAATSTGLNVLIVGIDGVDAASLSAYGYARETSPYLAKLRDESLFFENAFSNVGRTHGSLVTLLTGRLPFSTHVTFPPTALEGDAAHRHLPGLLKRKGTRACSSACATMPTRKTPTCSASMSQLPLAGSHQVERTAAGDESDVFRRAVAERLDERIGHLFGLRHAIDAYAQVEGREESPYWSDERRVDTLISTCRPRRSPGSCTRTSWTRTAARITRRQWCSRDPIVRAMRSQPAARGRRQRAAGHRSLRASGRLDRTIVVVTSDHTNGWTTKGRVPLLIRFPGGSVTGRVQANVQLADIAPTLIDYLGEPIPPWMDGVSLLDPALRERPRPVFGVSEIARRHSVGFRVTALDDAGAPNYGVGTATLISGAKWFELSLEDGRLSSGPVDGHTAPSLPSVDEATAHAMLRTQLTGAGFRIGSADH